MQQILRVGPYVAYFWSNEGQPLDWHANESADFLNSSSKTMVYEEIEKSVNSTKSAAFEMFGEMRSPTQEERNLCEAMLARVSEPIDVDIFAI
jgi:hypothetical protein